MGAAYDLLGRRADAGTKGIIIRNGRLYQQSFTSK